ncbi:2-hexaprenyl-6-methoxy-1,4-benzoquinone methyltransferase [Entomophthora muscae]|uniref:2-hexaprenyl-6-methoxy-1,4-benzoquinone methyltransferase n=1 Tax=Entomophthora muscae TaxID=34485 RepID=A0ACC2TF09_9FUNG|nr:2-hexaprenyl-6-methoxy-1,4-benzoquinone methyltransferase [Entomophthora muscae]
MNDFMSFGIHRLWKDHFIHTMAPGPGTKLLDVAGGTGDIALRFLEYCQKIHNDSTAHVRVVDINPSMLAHGSERYHKSQFKQNNQALFQVGNAECLENVEDSSVDVYTISFGIRNCTHIDRVLKEAYRVLKPGGRFMCLEFSKVDAPFVKQMYDLYSFQIIPQLGSIVANDRDSYQYLVESIRQFPDQKRFSQMIQEAGFATVGDGYENLTFGVAAMHTGYKF